MPIGFIDKVLPELVRSYREEGRPRLLEGTRDRVISIFERVTANPIFLDFYMGELITMEVEVPGMMDEYRLDEHELEALLEGRWEDIPDATVGMLMLRPKAIKDIKRRIDEELPYYWLKVYEREEKREMDTQ